MTITKSGMLTCSLVALSLTTVAQTCLATEVELYGSLRIQVESVSPDTAEDEDYAGFRDAYSRVGAKLSHEFKNELSLKAIIELPVDSANVKIQDPWDQENSISDTADIRIAKVQVGSPKYGLIWIGKDWMPYYNEIAYPVDNFSSYYSGFATFTTFRLDQTITYLSPDFNSLQFGVAFSHDNGGTQSNGGCDDRKQATISYMVGNTKLALGVDDIGGADNLRIFGISLQLALGDVYIGAKYERHQSDIENKTVYGHDGSIAANLYAQYKKNKHTIKGHIARVDNYGEDIFHVGYDYQLDENIKLFAEYYSEETGAAITTIRGGYVNTFWSDGGSAVLMGVRYDFNFKLK